MAKIYYTDHLDDLMERIMSEDITPEELEKTIKMTKVVLEIGKTKLDKEKLEIDRGRLKVEQFNALKSGGFIPQQLANDFKQSLQIENNLIE